MLKTCAFLFLLILLSACTNPSTSQNSLQCYRSVMGAIAYGDLKNPSHSNKHSQEWLNLNPLYFSTLPTKRGFNHCQINSK
ncbi:hypothetical protein [Helicobacter cetorum]|uniref:Lipoprotein n=1 Tax=Helicobacter cetorum (strain ATCC BAA-540 / CCUG 52418 / MIT 99-5656) TaxID=1163745 RepID=I0ERU3_HELCM|nr:hypothetical protein [Helicobacter cetorum]AFI05662.1 hypothetical protein HCD_03230 [Helicobacter cetorum MIT 99-5656]